MAVGHHSWAIVQVRIPFMSCRVPHEKHSASSGSKLTYHNAKGNDTSNITNRQLRHLVYEPSHGTWFPLLFWVCTEEVSSFTTDKEKMAAHMSPLTGRLPPRAARQPTRARSRNLCNTPYGADLAPELICRVQFS
jgi:hypothetical protein